MKPKSRTAMHRPAALWLWPLLGAAAACHGVPGHEGAPTDKHLHISGFEGFQETCDRAPQNPLEAYLGKLVDHIAASNPEVFVTAGDEPGKVKRSDVCVTYQHDRGGPYSVNASGEIVMLADLIHQERRFSDAFVSAALVHELAHLLNQNLLSPALEGNPEHQTLSAERDRSAAIADALRERIDGLARSFHARLEAEGLLEISAVFWEREDDWPEPNYFAIGRSVLQAMNLQGLFDQPGELGESYAALLARAKRGEGLPQDELLGFARALATAAAPFEEHYLLDDGILNLLSYGEELAQDAQGLAEVFSRVRGNLALSARIAELGLFAGGAYQGKELPAILSWLRELEQERDAEEGIQRALAELEDRILTPVGRRTWSEAQADEAGYELFLRAGFQPVAYLEPFLFMIEVTAPAPSVCDRAADPLAIDFGGGAPDREHSPASYHPHPCWRLYNIRETETALHREEYAPLLRAATYRNLAELDELRAEALAYFRSLPELWAGD